MPKLTLQAVAEHLGLSRQAAAHWLRRLSLKLADGMDAIRLAYVEHLRQQAATAVSPAREDWLRVRRDRERLKLERERGTLIERAAAVREYGSLVVASRSRILVVANRLKTDFPEASPPELFERLDALLREALAELADAKRVEAGR
jgi:hypothetical protein